MRFRIDSASLIVGSKFTVLALSCFVFEGNSPSTSPRGAYIWRGHLTEGFLRYRFGGAYIWRGLYMEGLIFGILRYLTIPWWEIVAGTYEPCKAHGAERKSRRLWTRDTRFFTPMNSGTCPIRKCICPEITLKNKGRSQLEGNRRR